MLEFIDTLCNLSFVISFVSALFVIHVAQETTLELLELSKCFASIYYCFSYTFKKSLTSFDWASNEAFSVFVLNCSFCHQLPYTDILLEFGHFEK